MSIQISILYLENTVYIRHHLWSVMLSILALLYICISLEYLYINKPGCHLSLLTSPFQYLTSLEFGYILEFYISISVIASYFSFKKMF